MCDLHLCRSRIREIKYLDLWFEVPFSRPEFFSVDPIPDDLPWEFSSYETATHTKQMGHTHTRRPRQTHTNIQALESIIKT